jgi:acetyl-CoA carboxylase biotin carboxylase subunit
MSKERVFVANRGEIALRIIDACDRLGIDTVLGASSIDAHSLPARRARRTIIIGGPRPSESYLNTKAIIHAALSCGCTALHPGYGFLSERADFAKECAENRLIFIGPHWEQLDTVGDKLSARRLAESVGVPVSPGGSTSSADEALELAKAIGFPVLIKAAFGGGGRGMKQVRTERELVAAWELASSEALASFGDGTVFVERFVEDAKHIEVQILGDAKGHCIHLGERECSVQFRYQKMIEEAPCSAISLQARERLHDYALRIAAATDYLSLGTVEFLYDIELDQICFLEINPRVQVEHPVTEAITGIDLVREQIAIALGDSLRLRQQNVRFSGHAIELRLTAQDPAQGLRPSPGRLQRWRPAPLGGVRWDTHLTEGELFPPFYDALMAKIIAFGADRQLALSRARAAIEQLEVEGVSTNQRLLAQLLTRSEMIDNTVTTRWLETFMERKSYNDERN